VILTAPNNEQLVIDGGKFYDRGAEFQIPGSWINSNNLPATAQIQVSVDGGPFEIVDTVQINLESSATPSGGTSALNFSSQGDTARIQFEANQSPLNYYNKIDTAGLTSDVTTTQQDTFKIEKSGIYSMAVTYALMGLNANLTAGKGLRFWISSDFQPDGATGPSQTNARQISVVYPPAVVDLVRTNFGGTLQIGPTPLPADQGAVQPELVYLEAGMIYNLTITAFYDDWTSVADDAYSKKAAEVVLQPVLLSPTP
jgi:hypothetical protein